jgi:hypothetical protein
MQQQDVEEWWRTLPLTAGTVEVMEARGKREEWV